MFPYFCFGFFHISSWQSIGSPPSTNLSPSCRCDTGHMSLHGSQTFRTSTCDSGWFETGGNAWGLLVSSHPYENSWYYQKNSMCFFLIFIQETGKYLIFGDLDIAYRQCSCESSSVCEQIHIYWYTHWKHQKASVLQNLRRRFCKSAELVSNSSLQIYASKGIHGKKHSLFK